MLEEGVVLTSEVYGVVMGRLKEETKPKTENE